MSERASTKGRDDELASARLRPEPSSVEAGVVQVLPNIAHAIEAWLFDGASDTHAAREVLSLPPFEKLKSQRDDALALAAAQNGGNRLASAEWTKALLKLRNAQKERDAIVAAGEALSLALSRYGFPMSDEAWRNTGDDAPAGAQASAEARALHRAATAFFQVISGAADVR